MIFIPGGMSTRKLRNDEDFLLWLQNAKDIKYKVSVCTVALLLGASGFLSGKKATTNPSAYELLAPYCSEVLTTRIVRDGTIFTGGGVSSSIDLGLFIIEYLTNIEVVKEIQTKMDYPYYKIGKFS